MTRILADKPASRIARRGMSAATAEPNNSEFDRVCRAAEKLEPLERDILAMSAGTGLLIGEIASLLGISERRVELLLARALYKFDCALGRQPWPWWHFW